MPGFVLFDTDILIDAGNGVEKAVKALEEAGNEHDRAISSITYMELMVGCRNKSELRALERFVTRFTIIPLDEVSTEAATALLREFRLSHGLLIPDALIAGTALAEQVPLVSKNQRDYRFIPELDLLPYPDPFGS